MPSMFHISISMLISILLLIIMFSLKTKHYFNFNSSKNIECGFNSMSMKKFSFSNQFFMVSILFVIFDMELIAILPIPLIQQSIPSFLLITSTMIILAFSIMMEWLNGLVEWTKS